MCRGVVHALRESGLSVEVLTTCVREFAADWNHDFHPEGTTVEGGVVVRRFRVRQRHAARFHEVNYKLMHEIPVTTKEEDTFVTEMINSPNLCKYIRKHRREYVFLFIPYMFGTTYWGSRECPDGAILIPCLHDEAYARMRVFRTMCERARGLIFNSIEERRLAERLYSLHPERLRVAGVPVNCNWQSNPQRFRSKYAMSDFFLYAGRTEKGKGAELLVEYFCRYLGETGRLERLVFIGGGELRIPEQYQSRIVNLGFLPEQDKYDAYGAAIALCVPSLMESFSIVTMESWLAGRPVIVNRKCAVTTEFCLQSNGGLCFADYEEFREILMSLADNSGLGESMGANGRQYVLDNFHPTAIAMRYRDALNAWGFPVS